jgi:hypothetical protein
MAGRCSGGCGARRRADGPPPARLPSGVVEVRAGCGGEGRLGAVRHFPDGCREGQSWLGRREAGPAPSAALPTTVVQVRAGCGRRRLPWRRSPFAALPMSMTSDAAPTVSDAEIARPRQSPPGALRPAQGPQRQPQRASGRRGQPLVSHVGTMAGVHPQVAQVGCPQAVRATTLRQLTHQRRQRSGMRDAARHPKPALTTPETAGQIGTPPCHAPRPKPALTTPETAGRIRARADQPPSSQAVLTPRPQRRQSSGLCTRSQSA